ncbi:hypothetical protein N1031_00690 [Herbiconiux moechotypicola]|uniref:Uncharacterized protein n=1 Tax=Herbiconiux moechotypicola TaxID=637393 RepID=A0ABN3D8B1_9MICO|nr:hypothetical protein [Herbiconiux moechotypicola]MCS5728268.1 hypothetical protein [Herbiconiux moechotypicola]
MKMKKVVALGAALGVAVAGLALAAPANADPISNSYVLVGSDTLDAASNALANGTNVGGSTIRVTANGSTIGSFDAFGSSTIQAKPNGPYFGRPSGSGDGVKALSRSIDGAAWVKNGVTATITGQVDIARSSSGPGSNANPSGPLLYVPFGRDAVSYAYKFGSGVTSVSGIEDLTATELTQIYNGTLTSIGGVTVAPKLPQTGSGTRNFWVGALGVGQSPAGVPDAATTTLQENNAAALTPAANTVAIIPFSAAAWVAQSNNVAPNTITGTNVLLGAIGGNAAYTGSGTSLVPNTAFYNSATFGRDTYMVVENARVTTGNAKYDAGLASLVDSTNLKSLTNFGASPASAGAAKKKFGFLAPSVTTTQRANLQ